MAYKVCLLDSDSAYQRALMQYLNMRAAIPVQLYAFTTAESYAAFRKTAVPELLLVGEEYADWTDICPVCVLAKQREYTGKQKSLFRYQGVELLVKSMLEIIEQGQKKTVDGPAVYAVHSPLGRCGKTQFAKEICRRFAKGLYVNWEGIPERLCESTDADMGNQLLYCLKSRNEAYITWLMEQGCTAIPPPDGYLDIRQIEKADLVWFQEAIREHTDYEVVVFDIGTMVVGTYGIFGAFDWVMVPVLNDPVSMAKTAVFSELVTRACGQIPQLVYVPMEGGPVEELVNRYVR